MRKFHSLEGQSFWPWYAARIPLFPPHRQAVMRRVLAENVGGAK